MKTIRGIISLILCLLLCAAPALAAGETLTTNGGMALALSDLPHQDAGAPATVYFIADISPESLVRAYRALGVELPGRVGVKISTGEGVKSNYLRPELIGDLVKQLNAAIVECNTGYAGNRASTAMHMQVAKDRGYTDIAEVDILDAEDSMALPVEGGLRLTEDYVGSHFANYGAFVVLSHFKGHSMAGFGGAIKNNSIGFGSAKGKAWIHSGGTEFDIDWNSDLSDVQEAFLEAMADAAKAVDRHMGDNIVYINVMNRLSVDCDCDPTPSEPDMHDVGILASTDPLAVDQACIDLVYAMPDSDSLVERIESRDGLHTLDAAEEIGLGSRDYRLVVLDD